jgi:orotidine-5'-phosphate decarboxylase
MTRNFKEMLEARWAEGKFVCVGLDTDSEKLPAMGVFKETTPERMVEFNAQIIDATKDLVGAYKPNIAFYEDRGTPGLIALETTMEYLREVAPDVPVILDNKRADIGNTNRGYVRFAFEHLSADACTVHPYMGKEAMKPFLDMKEKGIIVLCKTSNPGSGEFQDLQVRVYQRMLDELAGKTVCEYDHVGGIYVESVPLHQWVAKRVASKHGWNYNGNCGVVAGATYPKALEDIRDAVDDLFILCPGAGTQGGDVKATVRAACDSRGKGFLISNSSGIIFASKGPDFAEAARRETLKLHDEITKELLTLA